MRSSSFKHLPARVTCLVIVTLLSFGTTQASSVRPNILLFIADDLGYVDMGANNPTRFYETPNLDRLANEGARFTDAYAACPVCSPTQGGAPSAAIRRGDWKLIAWFEDRRVELFNVAADIGETTHLADNEIARVDALRAELCAWQQEVGARFPASHARNDATTLSGRIALRQ